MDRRDMPVLKESRNMCVMVNTESVVCVPALVNFCLYQLERRKGTWMSAYVLCEPCLCKHC